MRWLLAFVVILITSLIGCVEETEESESEHFSWGAWKCDTLEIGPSDYKYYRYSFKQGDSLQFQLKLLNPGKGNVIDYFYVLSEREYEAFCNNETFYPLYKAKSQTFIAGKVGIPSTGTYYVVIGNTGIFSSDWVEYWRRWGSIYYVKNYCCELIKGREK